MARARNIKPAIFKNELLGVADPFITLLFESLWCLADREGRLEDRPLRIKAETFPYRENMDINGYLTELARMGFIVRYVVDGAPLIQIVNFKKHQTPHKTEKDSVLPAWNGESVDTCGFAETTVKYTLNTDKITEALPPDLLIPDSFNLIPDSIKPQAAKAQAPKFNFLKSLLELGVEEKNALAWIQVRKAKRAPNTDVALQALVREADKAGLPVNDVVLLCAERNWQSFKSEWILPKSTGMPAVNHPSGLGVHGQATARAAQEWLASKERERNGQQ